MHREMPCDIIVLITLDTDGIAVPCHALPQLPTVCSCSARVSLYCAVMCAHLLAVCAVLQRRGPPKVQSFVFRAQLSSPFSQRLPFSEAGGVAGNAHNASRNTTSHIYSVRRRSFTKRRERYAEHESLEGPARGKQRRWRGAEFYSSLGYAAACARLSKCQPRPRSGLGWYRPAEAVGGGGLLTLPNLMGGPAKPRRKAAEAAALKLGAHKQIAKQAPMKKKKEKKKPQPRPPPRPLALTPQSRFRGELIRALSLRRSLPPLLLLLLLLLLLPPPPLLPPPLLQLLPPQRCFSALRCTAAAAAADPALHLFQQAFTTTSRRRSGRRRSRINACKRTWVRHDIIRILAVYYDVCCEFLICTVLKDPWLLTH